MYIHCIAMIQEPTLFECMIQFLFWQGCEAMIFAIVKFSGSVLPRFSLSESGVWGVVRDELCMYAYIYVYIYICFFCYCLLGLVVAARIWIQLGSTEESGMEIRADSGAIRWHMHQSTFVDKIRIYGLFRVHCALQQIEYIYIYTYIHIYTCVYIYI